MLSERHQIEKITQCKIPCIKWNVERQKADQPEFKNKDLTTNGHKGLSGMMEVL